MTTLLAAFGGVFGRPWVLPIALIGAVVLGWSVWRLDARRQRRLATLGDAAVVARLLAGMPRGGVSSRWRALLLGGATLLLGLALAGPQWGRRAEVRQDAGVDVALVLDVSSSMLAQDEGTSRLQRLKDDVQRLLVTMPSARMALVIVAGRSYVLTPLTADRDALLLFLDGLEPSMVSQGGSALAEGITQALTVFGAAAGDERAIVVMSDGESWDGQEALVGAASQVREKRISLITVSYGTTTGGTIPLGRGEVKRDPGGTVVITRADPQLLSTLAGAADGVFVDGASADRPGRIAAALRRLRQTERTYGTRAMPVQRYALFLWPALALLLLDAVLTSGLLPQRIGPRMVATTLLTLLAVPLGAQDRGGDDPMRLFAERKFTAAAQALRARVGQGDRSPRMEYNLASALLEADSIAAATAMLERVATIAPDAELRYRALFNLGLANLRRARADKGGTATTYANAAVSAYKRALRTRMDDADARWNLELALREQQRGGGGGGARDTPSPPQSQQGKGAGPSPLEQQRAAAVLASAARDERQVQGKRQRDGGRREPSGGRDW
jgi:Ca-activated chloride channel homolog